MSEPQGFEQDDNERHVVLAVAPPEWVWYGFVNVFTTKHGLVFKHKAEFPLFTAN